MPLYPFREAQNDLYASIGFAITQWSHLEVALAEVYVAAIGSDNPIVASAGFYAIINFNTKLAVVDATIAVRFHDQPEILARWATIQNRLRKRAAKRNHLAHFMAHWRVEGEDLHGTLVPSLWDPMSFPKYNGKASRPEYTPQDIEAFRLKAAESFRELNNLAFAIRGQPDIFPAFPEPD